MSDRTVPSDRTLRRAWAADVFAQRDYDVCLEWGPDGASALGGDRTVLIVVDVLAFSTTVDMALGHGCTVRPVRWTDTSGTVRRAPRPGTEFAAGTRMELPSPNGATVSEVAAATGARVLTGCLRNATAVASAALRLARGGAIGLVPAGERWGLTLGGARAGHTLRPCVEDYLGAGAIVAALSRFGGGRPSPEARLAAGAYATADVAELVRDGVSGRELRRAGLARDVELAVRHDVSTAAPYLDDGAFVDMTRR